MEYIKRIEICGGIQTVLREYACIIKFRKNLQQSQTEHKHLQIKNRSRHQVQRKSMPVFR